MQTPALRFPRTRAGWTALVHASLVGVLGLGFVVEVTSGSAGLAYGLLISAAILAIKKHGDKSDDADEDVQGKHPATRFLFRAANAGDFDDVEDTVDDDFQAYANGYAMLAEETDRGPKLLVDLFEYWRKAIPDKRWELYDEVSGKQEDKSELISFRFVATGTIAGAKHDIELAAFVRVIDKKMTEMRLVTDLTIFNEYRAAVGLPILE